MRTIAILLALSVGACSLPDTSRRAPSSALTGNQRTKLAARVQPRVAEHPGRSGFYMLPNGHDAFAARVALADSAERSLDVQYFIWSKDLTGQILLERLLRAADRGVRVRVLIDDLGSMPANSDPLALDSHPNLEVRVFNPAALRSPKLLGIVLDVGRMNRRMHNKSFTADGQVTIVGGRNIGDHYYEASTDLNFADLDIACIGPVVKDVSAEFDLYWNSRSAFPIGDLVRHKPAPGKLLAIRTNVAAHDSLPQSAAYMKSVRTCALATQMRARAVPFVWATATVVNDHPDKVISPKSEKSLHLAPKLAALARSAKREVYLISPYFVPGKDGVELLCSLRSRGLRVAVLTNSPASTDGLHVHGKYAHYRKPLLECGVELYELKPIAGSERQRLRWTGLNPGTASMHAKCFVIDRSTAYIGSYNLDPRSRLLNTEMGVVVNSPEITARMARNLDSAMAGEAWRIQLNGGRIEWATKQDGIETRLHTEPETTFMRRLTARFFGWLPIEGLL